MLYSAWRVFSERHQSKVYVHLSKLLKIAMTILVTSATAERARSKVKLVKLALRSTSKHDRMSDLIQIFVESDTYIQPRTICTCTCFCFEAEKVADTGEARLEIFFQRIAIMQ